MITEKTFEDFDNEVFCAREEFETFIGFDEKKGDRKDENNIYIRYYDRYGSKLGAYDKEEGFASI